MPQSVGTVSSASRHSGSSYTRRYRTLALTSQVDESLFGTPKLPLAQDTKHVEPRRNPGPRSKGQSRSAPSQRSQPDKVRIITKDLIRDLKIRNEDPSGLSIILPPWEMERITSASRVPTNEEREAMTEELQKKREETIAAAEERKAQTHQADLSRKKNQPLSELEAEARDRAQYLLERANAMRMEQEDEVKKFNELVRGAQCHAVRDAQILEKRQIQLELEEEERRLDSMMEAERLRALELQEHIHQLRKQQMIRGKQQIIHQMEERLEDKLLQEEVKEQEGQQMLESLERMQEEELKAMERKKEEHRLLQQEIIRINAEVLRAKEQKLEEERLADLRAMEFTQKKMEREADYEAEQKRIKREKEKEVARLRALQERDRDYKAEQDELRARRNREAAEREWRRKEKEQAQKKAQDDALLKASRLEQVVHKERLQAIEAGRARAEFERVLRAQQEAIAKQKEEEERQLQRVLHHSDGVRQQVREREMLAVARRRDIFKEGDQLNEEARQRRIRLNEIKEKKLMELKAAGLPEKYCRDVERKARVLSAVIH